MAAYGRYPTLRDALVKDEAALLTVCEAHAAVRHRCAQGECEARQVLDEALDRIHALLATEPKRLARRLFARRRPILGSPSNEATTSRSA
jgi:hypothetical protein